MGILLPHLAISGDFLQDPDAGIIHLGVTPTPSATKPTRKLVSKLFVYIFMLVFYLVSKPKSAGGRTAPKPTALTATYTTVSVFFSRKVEGENQKRK